MRIDTQLFDGHEFWLVGSLEIQRSANGQLVEYTHPLPVGERPNPHASGPFCRFGLPSAPHAEGVYAVTIDGSIQYVGECTDLVQRFGSSGYGLISPRNCHHDGQSTNCKMNSRVLAAAKKGIAAQVWFRASNDRKALEGELIAALRPPWNGGEPISREGSGTQLAGRTRRPKTTGVDAVRQITHSVRAEDNNFRSVLTARLASAERQGLKALQVNAGSLHREVGGYPGPQHRMPSCCAAMRAAMQPGDHIVNAPPKANGASVIIHYCLPRR